MMRTARSSSRRGRVSTRHPPKTRPNPQSRHLTEQTPPGADTPLGADTPPWTRHPPVNRMTKRCKNITLPQTSFAGGKQGEQEGFSVEGEPPIYGGWNLIGHDFK